MIRLGRLEGTLLFSFLLFFFFSLLYIFRSFDNNTLASWKWIFEGRDFVTILPYLLLGVAISLAVSWWIPLEIHPLPVLIVIAGMPVTLLWAEPELMLDSGRYFLQAKSLSEYGIFYFLEEWGQAISSWTDMPLVPFLYGLVLSWGNESRIAIQFVNTVIFILTVIVTYNIGKSLWGKETGFYAGLMMTGIPYLLTQIPQMLVDIHAMFFHLLAFFCFLRAIKSTGNISIFLASVAFVFAVFVKYSIWPLLLMLPLTGYIVYLQEGRQVILKRTVLVLLSGSFISLVLICLKMDVFSEQIGILLQYQKPALKLWGEGLLSSFAYQFHPFVALLVLFSVIRAYQLRDKRFLIVSLYLMLIIVLQIRRIRYMIPLMPFIALAAAYGLAAFNEIKLRRFIACMIVVSTLVILFVAYLPFFSSTSMMNIKKAGAALNDLNIESATVIVLPQENSDGSTFLAIPLLDLFTEKKIIATQRWPNVKPELLSPYSPLLFTWMLNKPRYYELNKEQELTSRTQVVISSEKITDDEYYQIFNLTPSSGIKHFNLDSGTFRYRTLVSISN